MQQIQLSQHTQRPPPADVSLLLVPCPATMSQQARKGARSVVLEKGGPPEEEHGRLGGEQGGPPAPSPASPSSSPPAPAATMETSVRTAGRSEENSDDSSPPLQNACHARSAQTAEATSPVDRVGCDSAGTAWDPAARFEDAEALEYVRGIRRRLDASFSLISPSGRSAREDYRDDKKSGTSSEFPSRALPGSRTVGRGPTANKPHADSGSVDDKKRKRTGSPMNEDRRPPRTEINKDDLADYLRAMDGPSGRRHPWGKRFWTVWSKLYSVDGM